jgi:hypothetical protein
MTRACISTRAHAKPREQDRNCFCYGTAARRSDSTAARKSAAGCGKGGVRRNLRRFIPSSKAKHQEGSFEGLYTLILAFWQKRFGLRQILREVG